MLLSREIRTPTIKIGHFYCVMLYKVLKENLTYFQLFQSIGHLRLWLSSRVDLPMLQTKFGRFSAISLFFWASGLVGPRHGQDFNLGNVGVGGRRQEGELSKDIVLVYSIQGGAIFQVLPVCMTCRNKQYSSKEAKIHFR